MRAALEESMETRKGFGVWFLGWAIVVGLHVGFALALAHLEGASMSMVLR
jgi:hypothetical protein